MQIKSLGLLAFAAALSACGGDDTGNPPANNPPSFGVTRLDLNFAENGTGPVTTLAVNNEAVANLGLQIRGPDASLFSIDATRALRFVTPPDFEAPRDQGANNVYNLTVTAIDTTGASATVEINVTVTNDALAGARYIDPIFSATADLGTVAGTGFDLALIGPAGDTLRGRPVMLVAPGGDTAGSLAIARGFAERGYVAGLISGPVRSYADSAQALGAAVDLVASPAFNARGFGIDSGTVFVAGEGLGARAAGVLGIEAGSGSPVRGAFTLGGGLFDPGRASAASAVLFTAGDARQGGALADAYRSSGVPMQFMDAGTGTVAAAARGQAIAEAARMFHSQVLTRGH